MNECEGSSNSASANVPAGEKIYADKAKDMRPITRELKMPEQQEFLGSQQNGKALSAYNYFSQTKTKDYQEALGNELVMLIKQRDRLCGDLVDLKCDIPNFCI